MGNKETAFSFYQYVTTLRISSGLKKLCPDKQRELEEGLQFNGMTVHSFVINNGNGSGRTF